MQQKNWPFYYERNIEYSYEGLGNQAIHFTVPLIPIFYAITIIAPWQVNITGQRSIDESGILKLNCTSDRSAVLSWFKKENSSLLSKVVSSSRISIAFQDVEGSSVAYSTLTIESVTVSDNNTYVCEAQDGDGFSHRVNYIVQINGIAQKHECCLYLFVIIVWHMYLYSFEWMSAFRDMSEQWAVYRFGDRLLLHLH